MKRFDECQKSTKILCAKNVFFHWFPNLLIILQPLRFILWPLLFPITSLGTVFFFTLPSIHPYVLKQNKTKDIILNALLNAMSVLAHTHNKTCFTVEVLKLPQGEEIAGWQWGKIEVSAKTSSLKAWEARKSVRILEVESDFLIIHGGVPSSHCCCFWPSRRVAEFFCLL